MKTTKKPVKKMQTGGKVKPTYKNLKMGVSNQSKAEGRDYTEVATKKDSADYRKGFSRGLKKDKESRNDMSEVEKMGRWEGLNTNKKTTKPLKKAKTGTSLGMKSVKAGVDKNPGVTRADIIAAATKQAKKGTKVKKAMMGTMAKPMMKYGGTMKKCRGGCK